MGQDVGDTCLEVWKVSPLGLTFMVFRHCGKKSGTIGL